MSSETPNTKWRDDFPIRADLDQYVSRREFTKFMVLVSGATCAGNGWFAFKRFEHNPSEYHPMEVAKADEIAPGGVKLFRYPTADDAAILIRHTTGEYSAFKQKCTHLSCPVHFSADRDRLECPCHNGAFDARSGLVLEGPPPRPLSKIHIVERDGAIFAEGLQNS